MKITKASLLKGCRDLVVFAAIIGAISLWQQRDMLDTDGSVQIPPKYLISLDGKKTPIFEQGKRTLVYFFAPWCNVCKFSIGNLEGIEDSSINVVRIALDYQYRNDVQAFVDENTVSGEILLGDAELKRHFNVVGYPSYYILDEQRNVVGSAYGYTTTVGLKIKKYLNK